MSTPANNVQLPQQLPGAQSAGTGFGQAAGSLGNYNIYDPNTFSNLSYGMVNNPYAGGYQSAAGAAGNLGTGGGFNMYQAGSGLYGIGNELTNNVFANQPGGQPQLYNFLQNQNTQQSNENLAQAGVATTPYGAGVTDWSNQQFNMNWQNFLQQQQLNAAGGAGTAFGQGAQLQQQAPIQYLYGGGLPYGTFNTIGQGGLSALTGLQQYGVGGSAIPTTQAGLYSNYATGATGANTNVANTGLNQANLGWQEAAAPWQGLGQLAGIGLGGLSYGYGKGLAG